MKEIMGDEVTIIYIYVPEQIRRHRAYKREKKVGLDPEIERRFKSDAEDFKDIENIADLVVINIDKDSALANIENFIEVLTI